MSDYRDDLRAAAALLRQRGVQYGGASRHQLVTNKNCRICAMQAIAIVCGMDPANWASVSDTKAGEALAKYVGKPVWSWNDGLHSIPVKIWGVPIPGTTFERHLTTEEIAAKMEECANAV